MYSTGYFKGFLKIKNLLLARHVLERHKPFWGTDLESKNEWSLLVSIILSLRNRDSNVNRFIAKGGYDLSVRQTCIIGHLAVGKKIARFGLIGMRLRLIYSFAVALSHGANLIDILDCKYFQIGQKTLDVARYLLLGKKDIVAVDTHTRKTFNKVYGVNWNISKIHKYLNKKLPKKHRPVLHILMVRYSKGINFCAKDNCRICPILRRLI